ncbi:MAG: hypothetical protein V3T39_06235 [Gammaproteobacteria bacterium]
MLRRQALINLVLVAMLAVRFDIASAAPDGRWQLTAEDWSRPRSGDAIREMPGIRQAVNAWMEDQSATIVITYPGGETGLLWAQEVSSWLVALGVPGEHLLTRSGSPEEGLVLLELLDTLP